MQQTFLKRIQINYRLKRTQQNFETIYKGRPYKGNRKWVKIPISPIEVVIIGERRLTNGKAWWDGEVMLYDFFESKTALLVVENSVKNPYYVWKEDYFGENVGGNLTE